MQVRLTSDLVLSGDGLTGGSDGCSSKVAGSAQGAVNTVEQKQGSLISGSISVVEPCTMLCDVMVLSTGNVCLLVITAVVCPM